MGPVPKAASRSEAVENLVKSGSGVDARLLARDPGGVAPGERSADGPEAGAEEPEEGPRE